MSQGLARFLLLHASTHFSNIQRDDASFRGESIQLLESENLLNSQVANYAKLTNSVFVFSSQHAVESVAQFINLEGRLCAAVGPATAERLRGLGAVVPLVPKQAGIAGLKQELLEFLDKETTIGKLVYFRGEVIKAPLSLAADIEVEEVVCYRMRARSLEPEQYKRIISIVNSGTGVIGVTSRQVFDGLLEIVREKYAESAESVISQLSIGVFSKQMADYTSERGGNVVLCAERGTLDGFLVELDSYCKAQ